MRLRVKYNWGCLSLTRGHGRGSHGRVMRGLIGFRPGTGWITVRGFAYASSRRGSADGVVQTGRGRLPLCSPSFSARGWGGGGGGERMLRGSFRIGVWKFGRHARQKPVSVRGMSVFFSPEGVGSWLAAMLHLNCSWRGCKDETQARLIGGQDSSRRCVCASAC
jgi:hypothetical protein